MPPRPSRRLMLVAVVLAVAVAAALAVRAALAPRVPAVQVQAAPLVRTLLFSARVATTSRVDVGSTVTGRVLEVLVREGDGVRRGQPLVRLERDEAQAALSQAVASRRQAEARLAGLRGTGRQAAQAAVAQAEAVLRAAQADLQRTRELVQRGFLSEARLDESRRAVEVAQAQRSAARAQAAAQADDGSELAQTQAQLALARSGVAAAEARLAQTVLAAPADARVLSRSVEPGQIVQPGRALLALALQGPLQLVALVDERYLEQLRIGQPARVQADAFPGRVFAATVQSLAPVIDPQRGAVEVKLSVAEGAPEFLREDMTLSVEVETGRRAQALVLPLQALQPVPGGSPHGTVADASRATVRVIQDGRARPREVRLGLRTLEAVEVLDGLAAGDLVLVGPAPEPGARVRADLDASAARHAGTASRDNAGGAMSDAVGR